MSTTRKPLSPRSAQAAVTRATKAYEAARDRRQDLQREPQPYAPTDEERAEIARLEAALAALPPESEAWAAAHAACGESWGEKLRRLGLELAAAYLAGNLSEIRAAGLRLRDFVEEEIAAHGDRPVNWCGEVAPVSRLLRRFEADLGRTYALAREGKRSGFDLKNAAGQFQGLAELAGAARQRQPEGR